MDDDFRVSPLFTRRLNRGACRGRGGGIVDYICTINWEPGPGRLFSGDCRCVQGQPIEDILDTCIGMDTACAFLTGNANLTCAGGICICEG